MQISLNCFRITKKWNIRRYCLSMSSGRFVDFYRIFQFHLYLVRWKVFFVHFFQTIKSKLGRWRGISSTKTKMNNLTIQDVRKSRMQILLRAIFTSEVKRVDFCFRFFFSSMGTPYHIVECIACWMLCALQFLVFPVNIFVKWFCVNIKSAGVSINEIMSSFLICSFCRKKKSGFHSLFECGFWSWKFVHYQLCIRTI